MCAFHNVSSPPKVYDSKAIVNRLIYNQARASKLLVSVLGCLLLILPYLRCYCDGVFIHVCAQSLLFGSRLRCCCILLVSALVPPKRPEAQKAGSRNPSLCRAMPGTNATVVAFLRGNLLVHTFQNAAGAPSATPWVGAAALGMIFTACGVLIAKLRKPVFAHEETFAMMAAAGKKEDAKRVSQFPVIEIQKVS